MRDDIRLALPSKGILKDGAMEFLANCGLKIFLPNPRQYAATVPALPGLTVLFQRPGDIVVGVRQGTVDFGVTGLDVVAEKAYGSESVLVLHDELGFGPCTLNLAVPDDTPANTMADLAEWAAELGATAVPCAWPPSSRTSPATCWTRTASNPPSDQPRRDAGDRPGHRLR